MDPGQESNVRPSDPFLAENFIQNDRVAGAHAKEFLDQLPSNTEEEYKTRFIREVKERKSVFPDAVMLRQFSEAGVTNVDPLVVRATGLIAQKYCGDIINESLMLIRVRGEGRVNKVTKEITYSLTPEVIEEVLRLKHRPNL